MDAAHTWQSERARESERARARARERTTFTLTVNRANWCKACIYRTVDNFVCTRIIVRHCRHTENKLVATSPYMAGTALVHQPPTPPPTKEKIVLMKSFNEKYIFLPVTVHAPQPPLPQPSLVPVSPTV